jgi:hypothetical protein
VRNKVAKVPGCPPGWRERLLFAAVVVLVPPAVTLLGIYLFRYRPRVGELRETNKPDSELASLASVDADTMRLLGHLRPDKRSAFLNFPVTKAVGVTRLCAFGDSYTQGAEVASAHDYPSFMQRLLDRREPGRFEVLNFGASWHGFHQAFIMWSAVGSRYGCDYVLLGPSGFQPNRDTRFNHTDYHSPYFLHARYVLDGGDVRLVKVIGKTYAERFDAYFRFFPAWRYLRYDRNAPFLLQSIQRRGRIMRNNPFYYYSGGVKEEALAIYRILMGKLLAGSPQVLIGHYWRAITELGAAVDSERLGVMHFSRRQQFPYVAPLGHNSAWGNEMVAEQFLAMLTGEPARPTVLELADLPTTGMPARGRGRQPPATATGQEVAETARQAARREPLSHYDDVVVTLQGEDVGRFCVATVRTPEDAAPIRFRRTNTTALLAPLAPRQSVLNACFVPLRSPLRGGAPVMLRLETSPSREVALGTIRVPDPRVSLGVVRVPGVTCEGQRRLRFAGNDQLPAAELARARGAEVLIDGAVVLRGRKDAKGGLVLLPSQGPLLRLRVPEGAFIDPAGVPQRGRFLLALRRQGEELRVPVARWWKRRVEAGEALRPVHGLLTLAPTADPEG